MMIMLDGKVIHEIVQASDAVWGGMVSRRSHFWSEKRVREGAGLVSGDPSQNGLLPLTRKSGVASNGLRLAGIQLTPKNKWKHLTVTVRYTPRRFRPFTLSWIIQPNVFEPVESRLPCMIPRFRVVS